MNAGVRSLFPGAGERVYLDIAARCLLPDPVRRAVGRHLDMRASVGGDKDDLWTLVEGARSRFAELIGAEPDEIGVTKNVSEGLNLFGSSLPWEPGDNVVVCPGLEHPNNIYLWYALRERRGVEVRAVEPVDGRIPVDGVAEAADQRTRLITFPSISFAPGFVTDAAGLVEVAHSVGALTLMDWAPSIGAMETNVRGLGVDALAVATQKCMLSVYGTGFLYIRRAVAEALTPIHVARYGVELEGAHETAFSDRGEIRYRPGARRFDVGNYNYPGAAAAGAALELLRGWGVEKVEKHVQGLAHHLAEGFLELGLPVVGGAPGSHLAHIVSVGRSGGGRHYTADDPAMNSLRAHLVADGIHHSIRSGVLRFSVGVYNNEADVEATLASARGWSRERS